MRPITSLVLLVLLAGCHGHHHDHHDHDHQAQVRITNYTDGEAVVFYASDLDYDHCGCAGSHLDGDHHHVHLLSGEALWLTVDAWWWDGEILVEHAGYEVLYEVDADPGTVTELPIHEDHFAKLQADG